MTTVETGTAKIREAVGVFGSADDLNEAVAELEATAFPRDSLSILGNQDAIEETFGEEEIYPEVAEDNPETPRRAPVLPEERGLGAAALVGGGAYFGAVGVAIAAGAVSIPAMITAAAIGGGAGGILAKVLGRHHSDQIEKQIEKGGLLLWVQTHEPEQEERAREIMKKHGAQHVHMHDIA